MVQTQSWHCSGRIADIDQEARIWGVNASLGRLSAWGVRNRKDVVPA